MFLHISRLLQQVFYGMMQNSHKQDLKQEHFKTLLVTCSCMLKLQLNSTEK